MRSGAIAFMFLTLPGMNSYQSNKLMGSPASYWYVESAWNTSSPVGRVELRVARMPKELTLSPPSPTLG